MSDRFQPDPRPGRGRLSRRVAGAFACAILSGGMTAVLGVAGASANATSSTASHAMPTVGSTSVALRRVGTVDIRRAAAAGARRAASKSRANGAAYHVTPLGLFHGRALGIATATGTPMPTARSIGFTGNVPGEAGIDGVTAAINGGANSPESLIGGVGDVTPPDQGLAVGASPAGTVLVEFVNDTLNMYSTNGSTLLGAVPAFEVFGLPPNAFLSDPRAYWDPSSGHWFLTMFTVGNSGGTVSNGECSNGAAPPNCLSTQYIAVSVSTDPFGAYTIFAIDTSDSSNKANGCPCFGDYDMVGSDGSGFYITTNEFPLNHGGPGFNGTVMYAASKSGLIAAADGGTPPTVQRYAISLFADNFAAYHVSPSTVTQGSSAPNTEYFVESNANLPNNAIAKNLEVYALLGTQALNSGGRPQLVMTTVTTESYSELPPNALQKSGPTPLGDAVGFTGTPVLQTDFNAVQEVTYAGGLLYAELDTGLANGSHTVSGAAWFVLKPSAGAHSVSVANAANGYVETSQFLLYPVIAVNAQGRGYMAFTASGPDMYPSAAYVTFDGTHGPGNVVHVAANGAAPLDDFSCYPFFGFSTGQCRWGDYSMAQEFDGHIYMATEYIGPQPRDPVANWGTRIWWAPDFASGYWLAARDGSVFAAGDASSLGGAKVPTGSSMSAIAATPDAGGYWLVAGNGAVYAKGDAKWLGDLPSGHVSVNDIVAIAPTADGRGYWLVGRDGGEFAFGDARYLGSLPGEGKAVGDIIGMVATGNGNGYWLVASDGGVFAFGNASYLGSLPGLNVSVNDIRAIAASPTGRGYVLVGSDGGTFVFGNGVQFIGSLPARGVHVSDVVGLALSPDARGYWVAGSDGTTYTFGDAGSYPSPLGLSAHLPIVGIAGA